MVNCSLILLSNPNCASTHWTPLIRIRMGTAKLLPPGTCATSGFLTRFHTAACHGMSFQSFGMT